MQEKQTDAKKRSWTAQWSAWVTLTHRWDQRVPNQRVLLLGNECAFWKWFHLSSVYLFIFMFRLWTNKNVTFLHNIILSLLSCLGYSVPTFTRTAIFPYHWRMAPPCSSFISSFAELSFPFIGFPVSVLLSSGTVPVIWPWGTLQGHWTVPCPL